MKQKNRHCLACDELQQLRMRVMLYEREEGMLPSSRPQGKSEWCARRDLNPQPSAPKADALSN